jgi:hypothetical protein
MIIRIDARRRFFIRFQALEVAGWMSTGTAAAFLRKEIASDHAHKHARGERLVGMVV